jgi:exosome complex exonuclease RRP6
MMYYARSDTHYLLYIYDNVRNDLIEKSDPRSEETNLIERALQKSRELSLSRHEHPGYNEETGEGSRGWYGYVFKNSHLAFDSEQFTVFKALWKWRDEIARKEDENPSFVLSVSSVADIARINPPDAKALHSLLPLSASLARPRFNEIWGQIKEAKSKGGPSLLHFFTSMAPDEMRKNGRPFAAKKTTRLPDIDGEVTVSRLTRSQLFGDMPISTLWEADRSVMDNEDDTIPFPWQRFAQDGSVEDVDDHSPSEEAPTADAAPVVAEDVVGKTEDEAIPDEEFTLKRGQKRKSEAVDEDSSSSEELEAEAEVENDEEIEDGDGVLSIVDETRKNKKERKRERKAQKKAAAEDVKLRRNEAKKARKARQKEKNLKKQEEQEKFNAVPFDYSKASSVLHTQRGSNGGDGEGNGKKKKVFDPYSKSAESDIKGARKAPPIRGERAATFKK